MHGYCFKRPAHDGRSLTDKELQQKLISLFEQRQKCGSCAFNLLGCPVIADNVRIEQVPGWINNVMVYMKEIKQSCMYMPCSDEDLDVEQKE